ncbi:PspC domain-containing protein [Nocardioides sp. zg-579]|uniref:PspC domain-containing protein n=2 Tax=Nocardioides marmotae TaxID=2663857 RepID=A0A6I3J0B3_9ACTN|nr:PspC domain-containing protein [Gordonia jinghuaiqii]MTB94917.1 PspC domain-containing protein [Nocardioides marmotae]
MVPAAGPRQGGAMTTTPPDAPPEPGPEHPSGPRASKEEVRDLGKLRRSSTDSYVAGVAGGLARHLDIDPAILRVAFVVLTFFGGAGLILYGAAWLLVPVDDQAEATLHLDERNRTVALTIAGGVAVLAMLGDTWGVYSFPWPVVVVAIAAVFVLDRSDRNRRRRHQGPPAAPAPYAAYGPAAPAAPGSPVGPAGSPDPSVPVGAAPGPYAGWAPPPTMPTAPLPPPPPAPARRRGPVLFWFTMALCALGIGVLSLLDLGGVPVPNAAYSALVVAVCGVMLLVGAFWGRAGGLIAVGLVAALSMAANTLATELDGGQVTHRPSSTAGLASSYQNGTGDLFIDLTDISDIENLDGRTLLVEMGVGRVEVLVPTGVDVTAETSIGIGNARVFGEDHSGLGIERTVLLEGGDPAPVLTLDAHVGVGGIEIHTEGGTR